VPGVTVNLRVVALNSVDPNYGAPSEPIELTPSALPNGSDLIQVVTYAANSLHLSWNEPADTGIGDTTIPILSY